MNDAIRALIEFVKRHDEISTEQAIEAYFSDIVWWLELDEWQRLSSEERRRFIQCTNGNAQPRTKMDKAKVIYTNGRKEGLARKAIIDAFVTKAGLTRKGSATHCQLLKTKEAQGKL